MARKGSFNLTQLIYVQTNEIKLIFMYCGWVCLFKLDYLLYIIRNNTYSHKPGSIKVVSILL